MKVVIGSTDKGVPNSGGVSLSFDDNDVYIRGIIAKTGQFYEWDVLSLLVPLLNCGGLFVDVGANVGNHSICVASMTNCDVVAFEPYLGSFEFLLENLEVNGLSDRVLAHNLALGRAERVDKLAIFTENSGQNRFLNLVDDVSIEKETVEVQVRSLDKMLEGHSGKISAIKIDVEGAELEVLLGGRDTIIRHRPIILVENGMEEGVLGFLMELGYSVLDIAGRTPVVFFVPDVKVEAATSRLAHHLLTQTQRLKVDISQLRRRLNSSSGQILRRIDSLDFEEVDGLTHKVSESDEVLQLVLAKAEKVDLDLARLFVFLQQGLSRIDGNDNLLTVLTRLDEIDDTLAEGGRMTKKVFKNLMALKVDNRAIRENLTDQMGEMSTKVRGVRLEVSDQTECLKNMHTTMDAMKSLLVEQNIALEKMNAVMQGQNTAIGSIISHSVFRTYEGEVETMVGDAKLQSGLKRVFKRFFSRA